MIVSISQPKYYILKQAISAETCALLTDYARFKATLKLNTTQSIDPLDQVHREYGDPMMELWLKKLTPLIEQTIGCAVWPSLSFYYVYLHGHQLKKHTDRSSCQWVASLCIGADPDFQRTEQTWPLMLHIDGQDHAVSLQCGDILLFKGHETVHWREVFTGQWFVSAIFAFVEQNGPFAFQKYDQRAALGKPHIGMFRWTWGCLKERVKQYCRQSSSSNIT